MGAWNVIREELPKFLNEDQAEGFRGVLSTLVPQDLTDAGLMVAGGPFGKLAKMGGLALAGAAYSPEAEAGGVTMSLARYLKSLIAQGEMPRELLAPLRRMQSAARNTGNEHAMYQGTERLLTSNLPNKADIPSDAIFNIQRYPKSLQAHTHPPKTDAAPGFDDLRTAAKSPKARALIITPEANPKFTSYKSKGLGMRSKIDPDEANRYIQWVDSHAKDRRALNWAEEQGLVDYNDAGNEYGVFSKWLMDNSPLAYLRDQELRGRLSADYNPGKVYLPMHDIQVPGGQLVDDFYFSVLDRN